MADSRLIFTGPSPFGGHRYVLFDQCPRRYGLEHGHQPLPLYDATGAMIAAQGTPEDEQEAASAWELIRGTLIHTGLAHYYALKRAKQRNDKATLDLLYSPLEAMEALHTAERARAHPDDRWNWDNALIVGNRVIKEYMKRYAFESASVVVVEEVFSMQLGENKAPYTFRLDLGLRDSSQKVWMVDHKTTTRLRPTTAWEYALSTQFQAYAIGGRAVYGENYGGVMANLIECVEPEDTEGKPVFARPDMPAVSGFLYGFAERVSEIYGRMRALIDAGVEPSRWPKRPGSHTCRAYGRLCPYYDRCVSTPD